MAVNVNTVYRTVLSVLNKEGRGFLTPDQFNKIGGQAQLDLLERAFYDYNRAVKKGSTVNGYGNIPKNVKEKIDHFFKVKAVAIDTSNDLINLTDNVTDLYRLVDVFTSDNLTQLQQVSISELPYILSSKLTAPSTTYPIFYRQQITDSSDLDDAIKILPADLTGNLNIHYIKKPDEVKWAYTAGTNSSYSYDSANAVHFELHPSDQVDLILKILGYAGVIVKDPTVLQAVSAEESKLIQLENS